MVLREDGTPVEPGETGVLYVRGPHVMVGYWRKPEQTAEMLVEGPLPGERMLCAQDHFTMDEDGFLYFVGRSDDIIKTRGEKVSPIEVENAIFDIDGVKEAAVVGVPDEVLGEAIKAFVVLDEGAALTAQEIIAACRTRLENFMVPGEVVFMDALPTTATGKVRRKSLREPVEGSEDCRRQAPGVPRAASSYGYSSQTLGSFESSKEYSLAVGWNSHVETAKLQSPTMPVASRSSRSAGFPERNLLSTISVPTEAPMLIPRRQAIDAAADALVAGRDDVGDAAQGDADSGLRARAGRALLVPVSDLEVDERDVARALRLDAVLVGALGSRAAVDVPRDVDVVRVELDAHGVVDPALRAAVALDVEDEVDGVACRRPRNPRAGR